MYERAGTLPNLEFKTLILTNSKPEKNLYGLLISKELQKLVWDPDLVIILQSMAVPTYS